MSGGGVTDLSVTRGDVTVLARVWYDADHGEDCRGWYAEYSIDGTIVDDSEKVGHSDMPTHPDAELNAVNLARDHARHLAAANAD